MNKSVSIVIPCRNEEKYIEKCILSILNSNYPKELFNVFVCDGMSDDKTREIIQKIAVNNSQVILLDNTKQTTPFALNIGLRESIADIKIILGAHSTIDANFIVENVKAFDNDSSIGCTGGVIENVYENETAKIIGLAMSSSFGVGNAHFRTGNKEGFVDTVAFGAYKKEVFEQIGYFDESLTRNQDDEFNYRLLKNGFKIFLSNKINCKYYVRGSFDKLYKQYFQYGYWKVYVNKKVNAITTYRQLFPAILVLSILLGWMVMLIHFKLWMLYLGGFLLYLLASMFFSIKKAKNLKEFFLINYCFYILHFSYGLGYLKGILDFIIMGKGPSKKETELTR